MSELIDREWQDGDDSALYDEGYLEGYAQATIDLIKEGLISND